ncbi:MAG: putative porin [Chitinophagales bacterium]
MIKFSTIIHSFKHLALFLILCQVTIYAQLPTLGGGGGGGGLGNIGKGGGIGSGGGTSRPILEKDTLNIDGRYDTILFSTNRYTLQLEKIDTNITDMNRYHPALQYGEFPYAHLGNTGQAHQPLIFEYQRQIGFQLGLRQFNAYSLKPEEIPYYSSPYPYSQIKYTIGPEEEQNFGIDFALHLAKTLNLFLRYQSSNAPGIYQRQRAVHRNFAGSVWYQHPKQRYQVIAHYLSNNGTIQQNGGVVEDTTITKLNEDKLLLPIRLSAAENKINERNIFVQQTMDFGRRVKRKVAIDTTSISRIPKNIFIDSSGVAPPKRPLIKPQQNPPKILNQDSTIVSLPRDTIPDSIAVSSPPNARQDSTLRLVRTPKKKTKVVETFVPRGRVGYALTLKNNSYLYDDQQSSDNAAIYYNDFYLGDSTDIENRPALLNNPLSQKTIQNEVFLMWIGDKQKGTTNIIRNARIGLLYQNTQLTQAYRIGDSTTSETITGIDTTYRFNTGLLNFQVENDVQKSNRRFNYLLKAQYALFGFNSGDFNASASINYPISPQLGSLRLKGSIKNLSPDFVQNRWFGHYFNWDNDFKKTQSLQIEVTYELPKLDLELSARTQVFDQLIVWNTLSQPTQLSSELSVSQFILKKGFRFLRKFHFDHTSIVQLSSSNFINLPTYWTFNSLYYQGYLFKGAAFAKVGLDVHYYTNYFANGYNPATGQFYLQNQQKLEFYPVVDAYINVKIQRVRLFLAMQHLNQGLIPGFDNGYFEAVHHPMQDRALKFGVRWMFFD